MLDDEEEDDDTCANQCLAALSLVEATLEEYPHNFDLLYVKTLLEERCHGGEAALVTAKHMLALWKLMYEDVSQPGTVRSESYVNTLAHSYSTYDARSVAVSAQYAGNDLNELESKTTLLLEAA